MYNRKIFQHTFMPLSLFNLRKMYTSNCNLTPIISKINYKKTVKSQVFVAIFIAYNYKLEKWIIRLEYYNRNLKFKLKRILF